MAVASIQVIFQKDIETVWEVVTSLAAYDWRSDLSKIEVLNEKEFVEHTKDGYATNFTTTILEPYKQWKFDMENDNMKGHWTGVFTKRGNETVIDFTEDVVAKKLMMKLFVKAYLKKQQALYAADLKKALS